MSQKMQPFANLLDFSYFNFFLEQFLWLVLARLRCDPDPRLRRRARLRICPRPHARQRPGHLPLLVGGLHLHPLDRDPAHDRDSVVHVLCPCPDLLLSLLGPPGPSGCGQHCDQDWWWPRFGDCLLGLVQRRRGTVRVMQRCHSLAHRIVGPPSLRVKTTTHTIDWKIYLYPIQSEQNVLTRTHPLHCTKDSPTSFYTLPIVHT